MLAAHPVDLRHELVVVRPGSRPQERHLLTRAVGQWNPFQKVLRRAAELAQWNAVPGKRRSTRRIDKLRCSGKVAGALRRSGHECDHTRGSRPNPPQSLNETDKQLF